MADITHDTHNHHRPRSSHRGGAALLIFLFVALLLAVFVASVMNMHGSVSWPAGRIEFGLKSPLPQAPPNTP